jgi:hypothetical protein
MIFFSFLNVGGVGDDSRKIPGAISTFSRQILNFSDFFLCLLGIHFFPSRIVELGSLPACLMSDYVHPPSNREFFSLAMGP